MTLTLTQQIDIDESCISFLPNIQKFGYCYYWLITATVHPIVAIVCNRCIVGRRTRHDVFESFEFEFNFLLGGGGGVWIQWLYRGLYQKDLSNLFHISLMQV